MTPTKSFTRSASGIIKCFAQQVSKVSGEQGPSSSPPHLSTIPPLTWCHWQPKPWLQERAQHKKAIAALELSLLLTPSWDVGQPLLHTHSLFYSSQQTHASLLITHTHTHTQSKSKLAFVSSKWNTKIHPSTYLQSNAWQCKSWINIQNQTRKINLF